MVLRRWLRGRSPRGRCRHEAIDTDLESDDVFSLSRLRTIPLFKIRIR